MPSGGRNGRARGWRRDSSQEAAGEVGLRDTVVAGTRIVDMETEGKGWSLERVMK